MRTDNVILGDDAMTAVRNEISNAFGTEFLSVEPRQYKSKVKNAQEAHEAIRPTLPLRSPDVIASEVNARELTLYKLIWQRTLASQMSDATGTTVTVKLGANTIGAVKTDCEFSTSGTTITFAGYRQAYQEVEEDSETKSRSTNIRQTVTRLRRLLDTQSRLSSKNLKSSASVDRAHMRQFSARF
jgi:DNA topoisomerase-1